MSDNTLRNLASFGEHTEKMPVLFVGHGSPMYAIEENEFVSEWRKLGASMPRPKAILCISAHWETKGTLVTAASQPPTIHDFGGFPRELYAVQYPAPGSPELAQQTKEIIKSTSVGLDESWGFDHGAWSVIRNIYPEADIPIIEMSLDYTKPPKFHYELAQELSILRSKGVLIIGSGNIVHNLRLAAWDKMNEPEFGFDWAIHANDQIKLHILNHQHRSLIDYAALGREVSMAIPSPDHYLPLLYALALQGENEKLNFFNDKAVMGSLTMTSLKIG